MRRIVVILGACVTLCLTGCFTVDTATMKWNGEEHVVVSNYGWSLFNWLPLGSGNADADSTCGVAFFRDDVTPEKVQARFMQHANGRSVKTLVYHTYDTNVLYIFGIPVPYILCYKEIYLSGTVK